MLDSRTIMTADPRHPSKFRQARPPVRRMMLLAGLVALGACGRRGDLEPPQAAVATPTPENRHNVDIHRASQKITPPKKDFVLDPLLQ